MSNLFQAFRTKNGYLIVGAGNDSQFQILIKVSKSKTKRNGLKSSNSPKFYIETAPLFSVCFVKYPYSKLDMPEMG